MGCKGCKETSMSTFGIDFTMAFQPIVDITEGRIWAYEALVRGKAGESAGEVMSYLTEDNQYYFDQACRVTAIELAGAKMPAGSKALLSINFMPNAVYEPRACIAASLAATAKANFNPHRLLFEFTEQEEMTDPDHVQRIVSEYSKMGFKTAIDDFGAGFAGLGLLARFQTDIIKIDMELVRGIDTSASRKAIFAGVMEMSRLLKFRVLAEGVETKAEMNALVDLGVDLFQGYYFAKPQFETFVSDADIVWM